MADTLLLTGASGVVGSEVARRLPADALLLGRHRARPESDARQIAIDIRDPHLGLPQSAYETLANEVTGIIHCAAITDMGGAAPGLEETNIAGVQHMVDLARAADAPLHYVSTAYCSETHGPKRPVTSAYVLSKRAAEAVVRESGLDWTIIRPSIVAGHSETGAIASFQGFHLFITSMLKGRLPIIPLERTARCDFVPADLIARGIEAILLNPEYGRTYWLTAGINALTIDEMIASGQPFARQLGRDLNNLIIADPDTALRDLIPALEDKLPRRLRERLGVLMELSQVMATERAFPSDFAGLSADTELSPDLLRATLAANIRHWGEVNNRSFTS
ncbi:MAG: SDR family oxidoreductase [Pseudomonadota bacterium]